MPHPAIESSFSPRRQPFLYLTAALTAGILLDRWIEPGRGVLLAVTLVFVAAAIYFVVRNPEQSTQTNSLRYLGDAATLALLISFVGAGTLLSLADRHSVAPDRLKLLYEAGTITPAEPVELTGILTRPPEPLPGGFFLDVRAEHLRVLTQDLTATGTARLMIEFADEQAAREFEALALDYGSRLRMLVRLERAKSFSNPGSADFNEFLERKGYDLKGTVKSPLLIENLGRQRRNPVLAVLFSIRRRMMNAIDDRFGPRVGGSLKAMLAGNRYFLDDGVARKLRAGATFHTLVIAGLHVGIIAWVLLGGRSGVKRRHPARVIVSIAVLWGYAVMVGLAPPVTRAAAMISVGLIGPMLFRRGASVNTLALAAFPMLVIDPTLVADPGFQLSFAAVGGIVALALPMISKLRSIGEWNPRAEHPHPPSCSSRIRAFAEWLFWNEREFSREMVRSQVRYKLDKSAGSRTINRWRLQPLLRGSVLLVITSAAIQLATLPLMVLYFNRVAPVGLLLNVVAGLLTGVLMVSALATLAAGAISVWGASKLAWVVVVAHHLLVNSIVPFEPIAIASFRAPQYEGLGRLVYAAYFAPLVLLAVLIDRWRPVDQMIQVDQPSQPPAGYRREEGFIPADQPPNSQGGRTVEQHPKPGDLRDTAGLLFARHRPRKGLVRVCALSLVVALVAVIRPGVPASSGKLSINFLDVGQGDAALVVFPGGSTMLIDGGGEIHIGAQPSRAPEAASTVDDESEDQEPDFRDSGLTIGEAVVSRFLWSRGLRRIDYTLATHAHSDHIGGIRDVMENFGVGELIVGHAPPRDREYRRLERSASGHGVAVGTVASGERFELDGVQIDVLWPKPAAGPEVTSGNNDSVVLRIVYGSTSFLMAGDLEHPGEESLVQAGVDLHADILKVGHHGSKTSSTDAFLDRVQPKYAVISVGERSRFGHPHAEVVQRYLARGIKLYQTGRDGTVTAETDGNTLKVKTYRGTGSD